MSEPTTARAGSEDDARGPGRRKPRPSPGSRRFGYPVAVAVNLVILMLVNVRHTWRAWGFLTEDATVEQAKEEPPQTTRAKLRGDFIRRAQEQQRDFTVDWVHLKLNDQAQRTVLCKDPFRAHDERVQRLIDGM